MIRARQEQAEQALQECRRQLQIAKTDAAKAREEWEQKEQDWALEREGLLRRTTTEDDGRATIFSWPQALKLQAGRCRLEANLTNIDTEDSSYWTSGAAACEKALELWSEEMGKVAVQRDRVIHQIAELMEQKRRLRRSVAVAVADRLKNEGDTGEAMVAGALRDLNEEGGELNGWVNW